MKKVLSLILAALMALSCMVFLASCDKETSDLKYVQKKGKLVVGITEFAPMDYRDGSDKWIGFDADAASAFAAWLGVDVEFIVIDWDSKELELDTKNIDCIWNGMTISDNVKAAMDVSAPYFNNAQVVIVPADKKDQFNTVEACKALTFAVEKGSAGADAAVANGFKITEVGDQATALQEAAAGTSDAAVIDFLMAITTVGEGTDYAQLTYTCSLSTEEYGVGFRKGSDLVAKLNEFFSAKSADLKTIADKYRIGEYLIVK